MLEREREGNDLVWFWFETDKVNYKLNLDDGECSYG